MRVFMKVATCALGFWRWIEFPLIEDKEATVGKEMK